MQEPTEKPPLHSDQVLSTLSSRSFLLEDRCRFLSNFSLATADVEIPGEYLMPKVSVTEYMHKPCIHEWCS